MGLRIFLLGAGLLLSSQLVLAVSHRSVPFKVILLDVDNTLYREKELGDQGIEKQIVQRIHNFCSSRCNLTPDQADRLHHEYGSSIEGIRQTLWKDLTESELEGKMRDFYQSVYNHIDMSGLWNQVAQTDQASFSTGYTPKSVSPISILRDVMVASAKHHKNDNSVRFAFASNSPKQHVTKVLQTLGLYNVPNVQILTPDSAAEQYSSDSSDSQEEVDVEAEASGTENKDDKEEEEENEEKDTVEIDRRDACFPTKARPRAFFKSLLSQYSPTDICLIDDSPTVTASIQSQTDMRVIQVSNDCSLLNAVGVAMGWIDPSFEMSEVKYLQDKNMVDLASIHGQTWAVFVDSLASLLKQRRRAESLIVVDLGAGLFSMLKLLLGAHDREDLRSKSLESMLEDTDAQAKVDQIVYYAYEPNAKLLETSISNLLSLGFTQDAKSELVTQNEAGEELRELVFFKHPIGRLPYMEIRLRLWDYRVNPPNLAAAPPVPDVIMGCCFADLMEPPVLVQSILQQFLSTCRQQGRSHALVYFPITFCGTTQFMPPLQQSQTSPSSVPSDAAAFALYSRALCEQHGHNLDTSLLVEEMERYSGKLLAKGSSEWDISPVEHDYTWQTMMYFFGCTTAPQLHKAGLNAFEWLQQAREEKPNIQVSNHDLLFRVPFIGVVAPLDPGSNDNGRLQLDDQYEEIQFRAPRSVTTILKPAQELGPNQVRISASCSLVSSGTELKIFKGEFDSAALDVNIKDMEDEKMAYPLAYGYCLVGHVVECGNEVIDREELLGRLVFAFSPHSSQAVADRGSLQLVPEGIDPFDAIFMPSVETALSIVHDANLRMGEKVGVFGQGLIGLLVTAILRSAVGGADSVTTFDTIPRRLAASAALGASQALLPSQVKAAMPFDVAIEVSGNQMALQSAIDNTRDFGRVILASWYGNANVELNLGIDFHRSHKTILASQVSELPPSLSGTWTKARRFSLAWDLVRDLRPSQLLTRIASLNDAQEVYKALENGEEIAVAFNLQPNKQ